jgi:hypothetical protein
VRPPLLWSASMSPVSGDESAFFGDLLVRHGYGKLGSILSSCGLSRNRPFNTTEWTRRKLRMSSKGFASSITRSAILPDSTVPSCWALPRNLAGLIVAVRRLAKGKVLPERRTQAPLITSPGNTYGKPRSVPARSPTPELCSSRIWLRRHWNTFNRVSLL